MRVFFEPLTYFKGILRWIPIFFSHGIKPEDQDPYQSRILFLIVLGSVGRIQVRFRSRRLCDRLVKPQDKTGILLGKVNTRADKTIPGVSDKVHPILVQWKRPEVRNIAIFTKREATNEN